MNPLLQLISEFMLFPQGYRSVRGDLEGGEEDEGRREHPGRHRQLHHRRPVSEERSVESSTVPLTISDFQTEAGRLLLVREHRYSGFVHRT